MKTHKSIFDERGFLTPEGKIILSEGFLQEVRKLFETAASISDSLILSGILKSVVAECAIDRNKALEKTKNQSTQPVKYTTSFSFMDNKPQSNCNDKLEKNIPTAITTIKPESMIAAPTADIPPIE